MCIYFDIFLRFLTIVSMIHKIWFPSVCRFGWYLQELSDADSSIRGEAVKQDIGGPENTPGESGGKPEGYGTCWLGHLHLPFGRVLLGTGPGLDVWESSVLLLDCSLRQRRLQVAIGGRRRGRRTWNRDQPQCWSTCGDFCSLVMARSIQVSILSIPSQYWYWICTSLVRLILYFKVFAIAAVLAKRKQSGHWFKSRTCPRPVRLEPTWYWLNRYR